MTFTPTIGRSEGQQIIGWHMIGLSPRDIRDLMRDPDTNYPYPIRSMDGIRAYLRRHGIEPLPSARGPKDFKDTHCESDRHPGEKHERKGKNNECPRCKVLAARERRAAVREGLDERVEELRAMGGRAAEIADWIENHVRIA